MIINSDDLILDEDDEAVYIQQSKLETINEDVLCKLQKYIKSKKFAHYVLLTKIKTLNTKLEVIEPERLCIIVKPTDKFCFSKHAQNMFDILEEYIVTQSDLGQFVDVSVIGHCNTLQFRYNKEDCLEVF